MADVGSVVAFDNIDGDITAGLGDLLVDMRLEMVLGVVALMLGRRYIGIELDPRNKPLIRVRLAEPL